MAYTKYDVQTTKVERVNGLDLGGVSATLIDQGSSLLVTRKDGTFHPTAALVEYERAGAHIYAKDENGVVYTNSEIYEQRFQNEIARRDLGQSKNVLSNQQKQQANTMTVQEIVASKCLTDGKHPKVIGDFDPNRLIMVNSEGRWYVDPKVISQAYVDYEKYEKGTIGKNELQNRMPYGFQLEDMERGLHLQLDCAILDVETGGYSQGMLDVPCAKEFFSDGQDITIASRSSIFSSIDFSREFNEMKIEFTNHSIDFDR
jgi:hypothetical protein